MTELTLEIANEMYRQMFGYDKVPHECDHESRDKFLKENEKQIMKVGGRYTCAECGDSYVIIPKDLVDRIRGEYDSEFQYKFVTENQ